MLSTLFFLPHQLPHHCGHLLRPPRRVREVLVDRVLSLEGLCPGRAEVDSVHEDQPSVDGDAAWRAVDDTTFSIKTFPSKKPLRHSDMVERMCTLFELPPIPMLNLQY